jgi:hypothetical protein
MPLLQPENFFHAWACGALSQSRAPAYTAHPESTIGLFSKQKREPYRKWCALQRDADTANSVLILLRSSWANCALRSPSYQVMCGHLGELHMKKQLVLSRKCPVGGGNGTDWQGP